MTALFASHIRSIASLGKLDHDEHNALDDIIIECNAQTKQVVTLTVEQARAICELYGTSATEQIKARIAVRDQLDDLAELDRIDVEERHRARQS